MLTFISNSVRLWKTTPEAYSRAIAQDTIKCGIYQVDALSSLLFCICPNPLITKTNYRCRFRSGVSNNTILKSIFYSLVEKSVLDYGYSPLHNNSIGIQFLFFNPSFWIPAYLIDRYFHTGSFTSSFSSLLQIC